MTKSQLPSRGPDYGIAKILRGFPNFEDYYQGLSRKTPIALSPYRSPNQGRDSAAKSNYDVLSRQLSQQVAGDGPPADGNVDGATSPELLEGVSVTLGANVIFAFPIQAQAIYKITWRLRTADFYAKSRQPYHSVLPGYRYSDTAVSTQNGCLPDTVFAGAAAKRAPLATFEETIRVTASTTPYAQSSVDMIDKPISPFQFTEDITVGGFSVDAPLSPILPFVGGNGAVNPVTGKTYVPGEYSQSPLVQAISANVDTEDALGFSLQNRTAITHVSYSTRAKGDECVVTVFPADAIDGAADLGTYDFDQPSDIFLSACFGRGGYEGIGSEKTLLFPQGTAFGVYVIQGHD